MKTSSPLSTPCNSLLNIHWVLSSSISSQRYKNSKTIPKKKLTHALNLAKQLESFTHNSTRRPWIPYKIPPTAPPNNHPSPVRPLDYPHSFLHQMCHPYHHLYTQLSTFHNLSLKPSTKHLIPSKPVKFPLEKKGMRGRKIDRVCGVGWSS